MMNLYKVTFANNIAVAAQHVFVPHYDGARMQTMEGANKMKWIIVFADDEQDSMRIANKVARDSSLFLKTA